MKDKEKQIEEMVKITSMDCGKCGTCKFFGKATNNIDCIDFLIANELYEQGYRKIDKDSVVLSKEEYEKLKHYEWRVTSGVCMTQKEWFDFCNEDSNRRTCLRIEEREKERKETVKKILFNFESAFAYYDNEDMFSKKAIFECIEEIAKQFGLEIKE